MNSSGIRFLGQNLSRVLLIFYLPNISSEIRGWILFGKELFFCKNCEQRIKYWKISL